MAADRTTDFDDWLVETFRRVNAFTMLIVLLRIEETSVEPLASSYIHVIGDEIRWADMVAMFRDAGASWNGAAFFQGDRDGLIDDATAKWRLSSLSRHLRKDRSILTHSDFFNSDGLRLKIEQITTH